MVGVVITLATLGWTIFIFLIPPSQPVDESPTVVGRATTGTSSLSPTPNNPITQAPLPSSTTKTINLDETVTGTLYFNEGNEWRFSDGPATINIILDVGPQGDALLMLFDSGQVQREYVDAQSGSEERLINYAIPDDGVYTIFVRNC